MLQQHQHRDPGPDTEGHSMVDACVQTSSELWATVPTAVAGTTPPTVTVGTHYGKQYLDPSPVAFSADALEGIVI